jgi:hypothetical protein
VLLVGVVTTALGATGCGGQAGRTATEPLSAEPTGAAAAGTLPAGHPGAPVPAPGGETRASTSFSGFVREVLRGGGYTYARLSVDGGEGEMWVAGPEAALEVGQEVAIAGAMAMGSFTSASLGRTFDDLYFVGSFQTDAPPPGATRGEALQVMASGGYTYVQARVGEEELWVAGPETPVTEGDTVLWVGGMNMGRFHSPTLDRTFEAILFVERFWVRR